MVQILTGGLIRQAIFPIHGFAPQVELQDPQLINQDIFPGTTVVFNLTCIDPLVDLQKSYIYDILCVPYK